MKYYIIYQYYYFIGDYWETRFQIFEDQEKMEEWFEMALESDFIDDIIGPLVEVDKELSKKLLTYPKSSV
jgi:hypothetical protein